MPRLGATITGSVLASAVLALGACGGNSDGPSRATRQPAASRTIDIYSSLPRHGPSALSSAAIVKGIRLALREAGNQAGEFKVRYISLDDSTVAAGGYSAASTAANARRAAADARAVYYIGEFDSRASEISIPILNEAEVAQVSPASSYVGLTTSEPGSTKGEPTIYYPAGTRTFLRIVPPDSVGAAADLLAMKQGGCTRVAEANDATGDAPALAKLVVYLEKYYGIDVVSESPVPSGLDPASFATRLRAEKANCFLIAGTADRATDELTKDVLGALPRMRIFGSDGMCTDGWANPRGGDVPAAADPQLECTSALLPLADYPGGRSFLAAYRGRYGDSDLDPYAIYGYEAMKLGLDTIAALGPKGDEKSAVVAALFAIQNRNSVLGPYGFDRDGDTTLASYGLYRVGPGGRLLFTKKLTL